jgi:hypothetical protein
VIVLWGWGAGLHSGAAAERTLGGAIAYQLFLSIGMLVPMIKLLAYDRYLGFAAFLAWVGLVTWMMWRTRKGSGERGGVLQIRLSREGFGQRIGEGEVKLKPWRKAGKVIVNRNLHGRVELQICARTFLGMEIVPRLHVQFDRIGVFEENELARAVGAWHAQALARA